MNNDYVLLTYYAFNDKYEYGFTVDLDVNLDELKVKIDKEFPGNYKITLEQTELLLTWEEVKEIAELLINYQIKFDEAADVEEIITALSNYHNNDVNQVIISLKNNPVQFDVDELCSFLFKEITGNYEYIEIISDNIDEYSIAREFADLHNLFPFNGLYYFFPEQKIINRKSVNFNWSNMKIYK